MSTSPGIGLVGTVLGGAYKITRLIGQGGMGAVYEGVQLRLERRVAVKLMARELSANAEAIARFRREAEVTSQLGHPHIVQVFDFGAAPGGEPYLVMEYLEGEDLAAALKRGALSPVEAAGYVRQACAGIAEAHALGIIHRDVKPANLFLAKKRSGETVIKVLDFGISKLMGKQSDLAITATQAILGSPYYMSPEQMRCSRDVDVRADIWALGVTLYELVTGKRPFVGDNLASLMMRVLWPRLSVYAVSSWRIALRSRGTTSTTSPLPDVTSTECAPAPCSSILTSPAPVCASTEPVAGPMSTSPPPVIA